MWAFYVGLRRTLRHSASPTDAPVASGVSVVVVFRNEERNLPRLLAALRTQTLPPERWEALLIDDGSTDCGPQLVIGAGGNVRYVRSDGCGKKAALMQGLSRAQHSLVAICDADCQPAPTWLAELLRQWRGEAMLQGAVLIEPQGHWLAPFDALDYASLQAASAAAFGLGRPFMAAAANLAVVPAAIPCDAQLLRPHIDTGDDTFLLHAAKQRGLSVRCTLSPAMAVRTRFEGGLLQRLQRRMRWASKATAYTDSHAIAVTLLVAAMAVSQTLALLLAIAGAMPWTVVLLLWGIKLAADTPLMLGYLRITHQLHLLPCYIPLQVVYPIYTLIEAIGAMMRKKNGVKRWL